MYSPVDAIRGVAWAHQDITQRRKAEAQMERLSLQKVLGRLLAGDCSNRPVAIAVFDLDNFKDVNDTLGHSVGDQLLVEVGQRFTEATRKFDKVQIFRLGGVEFVLVVAECGDPRAVGAIVDAVLRRNTRETCC
jgi:diguanylate cyclase (GGDEF)-like protein